MNKKNKKNFKIKNGILKEYNGKDSIVTIPDNVTSIGDCAFYNCTSLKATAM